MTTNGTRQEAIPATLEAFKVSVTGLRPFGRNPRQGDVGAIVQSLQRHGQYRPIVVNSRTMEVLAGNHTLEAVRQLGWAEVAASFVDVDEDQAARIVLVDNRSNDLATYDDQALADLLRSLPDLAGTGYDGDALDDLIAELEPRVEGLDTEPIDPPAEPVSRPGDLLVLGEHRVLCGDSAEADDVARLLDGDRPEMVFTDPPYGIDYRDVKGHHRPIANDARSSMTLVRDALENADVDRNAPHYVCCDWRSLGDMAAALVAVGIAPKACIVWDKQHGVQNLDRYFKQHEFVLYAGPFGGEATLRGDVWPIAREPNPGDHPTPKPVELIENALRDAGARSVVDLFAGSGSTLIAAENLGLRAWLMEFDPAYCDVIVDRWERHTGGEAERIRDGAAVEAHA